MRFRIPSRGRIASRSIRPLGGASGPALSLFAALSLFGGGPCALVGQEPTTGGFLFAYAPHSGERSTFEAGYRRHLDWHVAKGDSLSWYGWDVVVGPRPGLFVDGVFGVPFAALDERVDPAGDQEDAAVNFLSHADPVFRELVALRPDLSTATPLGEAAPSLYVEVVRYPVAHDGTPAMTAALSALRERRTDERLLPYTVYEKVAGARPGFVLMIWRERLATFDDYHRDPQRALRSILSAGGMSEYPLEGVGSGSMLDGPVTSELWRYRRDLTYLAAGGHDDA